MIFLPFWINTDITSQSCEITLHSDIVSLKSCNITSCSVMYNVTSVKPYDIIQLLTYVEVDVECY